jgi:hypothetical protein
VAGDTGTLLAGRPVHTWVEAGSGGENDVSGQPPRFSAKNGPTDRENEDQPRSFTKPLFSVVRVVSSWLSMILLGCDGLTDALACASFH